MEQLNGLASIELSASEQSALSMATPLDGAEDSDEAFFDLMSTLQRKWRCKRVALCRKVRPGQRERSMCLFVPERRSGRAAPQWLRRRHCGPAATRHTIDSARSAQAMIITQFCLGQGACGRARRAYCNHVASSRIRPLVR